MQRIERYGVIALVFLLVTIVAVSLWGERKKTDGWFSFLDRDSKTSRVEELLADADVDDVGGEAVDPRDASQNHLPLSDGGKAPVGTQAFAGPVPAPGEYDDFSFDGRGSVVPPAVLPSDPIVRQEPSESAVEPPIAPPASVREYTIRAGDTLSQIAQRELGTKDRWRELVELNPGLDPARLRVGTKIRVGGVAASAPRPPSSGGAKLADAEPAPSDARPAARGRSYTVRAGDTLSQIAQRELGTKDRWRQLVELNPGLDPARLHVGRVLRLPDGEAPREPRVARAEPTTPIAAAPSSKTSGSKVR